MSKEIKMGEFDSLIEVCNEIDRLNIDDCVIVKYTDGDEHTGFYKSVKRNLFGRMRLNLASCKNDSRFNDTEFNVDEIVSLTILTSEDNDDECEDDE